MPRGGTRGIRKIKSGIVAFVNDGASDSKLCHKGPNATTVCAGEAQ